MTDLILNELIYFSNYDSQVIGNAEGTMNTRKRIVHLYCDLLSTIQLNFNR